MLWPTATDHGSAPELGDRELERLYRFPDVSHRPWLAVNFVSSADGAATADGRSRGLSNEADEKVFALGRDLCDVVLVGAGTARVERYHGVKSSRRRIERRRRHGLAPVPPVALVSGACSITPDAPVIADAATPSIVLTCERCPHDRRTALVDAGADVVVTGTERVDLAAAVRALAERGYSRICCEGGPRLFAALLAAGLVDELRLTVAPLLTAGTALRIAQGSELNPPRRLELASVLSACDALMLRYLART